MLGVHYGSRILTRASDIRVGQNEAGLIRNSSSILDELGSSGSYQNEVRRAPQNEVPVISTRREMNRIERDTSGRLNNRSLLVRTRLSLSPSIGC